MSLLDYNYSVTRKGWKLLERALSRGPEESLVPYLQVMKAFSDGYTTQEIMDQIVSVQGSSDISYLHTLEELLRALLKDGLIERQEDIPEAFKDFKDHF